MHGLSLQRHWKCSNHIQEGCRSRIFFGTNRLHWLGLSPRGYTWLVLIWAIWLLLHAIWHLLHLFQVLPHLEEQVVAVLLDFFDSQLPHWRLLLNPLQLLVGVSSDLQQRFLLLFRCLVLSIGESVNRGRAVSVRAHLTVLATIITATRLLRNFLHVHDGRASTQATCHIHCSTSWCQPVDLSNPRLLTILQV